MADDMGWGDTGYNGHPHLQTPHLDQMAADGLQFTRFYSAAPVCSPTRGSCLTGRHPYRYGIPYANSGHLKDQEITIAEIVKDLNYRTGHFGKWHLGTLTNSVRDGRRGGTEKGRSHFSPPWKNGFDECFSTEAQMPTWNPMENQAVAGKYWTGDGQFATDELDGDSSKVSVDRALDLIRRSVDDQVAFFIVIWFHTPHSPVVASPEHRKLYSQFSENKQHYFGCVTAMDEQIGRLRRSLADLNISNDTMLWFCSDNGPAAKGGGPGRTAGGRQQGSAGGLRGRKGSLYDGGIRVPGLLVWPSRISDPRRIDAPCVTSDYLPTLLDVLDLSPEQVNNHPLDGISLVPLFDGTRENRGSGIGFQSRKQAAWIEDRYKLYSVDGEDDELYDIIADRSEKRNLAAQLPETVRRMKDELAAWQSSCKQSSDGLDYGKTK